MHRRAPRFLLLPAVCTILLLAACQDGSDVAPVVPQLTEDFCLPFEDNARMHEILDGDWRVSTTRMVTYLTRCDRPADNGRVVVSDGSSVTHHFAWQGLVYESYPPGFSLWGSANDNRDRFTAFVNAGSCVAHVRIWTDSDRLWFVCPGEFDPAIRKFGGACTEAVFDSDADPLTSEGVCALTDPVTFEIEAIVD